jgi:hypothetical protein
MQKQCYVVLSTITKFVEIQRAITQYKTNCVLQEKKEEQATWNNTLNNAHELRSFTLKQHSPQKAGPRSLK